jgi:hypothetical protein
VKIWNLFRNLGPARRVGSPQDQFRASDLEFNVDEILRGRCPTYLELKISSSRASDSTRHKGLR